MSLFEILLIVAVVSLTGSGVFYMMGKKTAAKWLLILGVGIFWLVWAVFKDVVKDSKRKGRPGGNFR